MCTPDLTKLNIQIGTFIRFVLNEQRDKNVNITVCKIRKDILFCCFKINVFSQK